MGQNIIELGFDIEKITNEKKQVLDLFVDLFGKLQEYDNTKFNPLGSGGLTELRKSIQDGANAMAAFGEVAARYNKVVTEQYERQRSAKQSTDELTLATKAYQNIVDQTAKTQAQASASGSDAAQNLAQQKIILQQVAAENKNAAREALGLIGEYERLEKAFKAASLEAKNIGATLGTNSEEFAAASSKANQLNEQLKAIDAGVGNFQRHVGNYAGSLAPAFDSLKEQLEIVNKELAEVQARGKDSFQNFGARTTVSGFAANQHQNQGTPSSGGPTDLLSGSGNQVSFLNQVSEAEQKLILQQKVLEGAIERQKIGFKTSAQEIRNAKNTLDTMTLAGLENTEAFEKLNIAYTENKQKVNELHEEQKILTSEEPGFTALAAAARGLGGAYAVGAGASALFASGNEKVEKELNKLVAIMTLLQGLEEAVKAVKDRGAIATALQASAVKALNAVRQIEVAIFGEETAIIEANTIATEENAVASEGSVAALEAHAVAAEATTGAVEGVTIAEEGATAATISFRTALISTGIGAIIVALIYGITKLVGAISDWTQADEKAIEKAKALAEANKELFDLNQKLNEVYEDGAIHRLNSLQKVDEAIKASGKNQFIQLDNERRIQEQTKQIASDQLTRLGVTDAKRQELQTKQRTNYEALIDLQRDVTAATAKGDKDEIEKAQKRYDANKAIFDLFESKYSTVFKLIKDLEDADSKLNVNAITTAKAGADELEKIAADSAQRRYAIEKDAADRTLNDPKSSFSEREAAVTAGYRAEESLAIQHIAVVRKQIDDQKITEAAGANEIANIQNDLNLKYKKAVDDRVKLRTEERDRNITAQNSVSKNNNESDAAIQEAITKDIQRELDARLTALKANIDDKTKIINDDYNTQLKLAKDSFKTQDEIAQLTSDRDKQLVALTADTQKQIYDLVTSYGERKLKAIEDQNKTGTQGNAAVAGYNSETDALNSALINRTISYSKYLTDKKLLDQKYAIEKAEADVIDDEATLKRIRDFEVKENGIRLEFARIALDLAKKGGNDKEIADAQAKFDALKAIQTKANADDVAATKKLNDDKLILNKAKVKPIEEIDALLADKEKQLAVQSFDLAKTLVDASYENRINQIQSVIDKQNEQSSNEVAAIQRSTLSQQAQAQEIIILTAQQKAQETALKNEQKKEKIAEAKFDRDVAVAEIAWNTAKAIMKDTAGVPWPLNLAVIAADVALGAVQAAAVLAKPIPTYAEGIGIPGKGSHPGGYAVAGEAGPELVSIPGREPFVLRQPTLIDLPVNSSVQPLNVSDLTYGVGEAAMQWQSSILSAPVKTDADAWAIARWQSAQMRKALKSNQQKIINKIDVHVDADWGNYISKKVTGRG